MIRGVWEKCTNNFKDKWSKKTYEKTADNYGCGDRVALRVRR